jgi:hypothetical protein
LRSPVSAAQRRVRQPSRSLSQIDDGRAVGALQMFDHQRQLAAVSRGGRPGRVAAFVRTGDILRLRLRRLAGLNRVLRSLVDGDAFQTGRRQFERVTMLLIIEIARLDLNLRWSVRFRLERTWCRRKDRDPASSASGYGLVAA